MASHVRDGWRAPRRALPPLPPRRACPSGCGFACTWHPDACCEACRLGYAHGSRCDRLAAPPPARAAAARRLLRQMLDPEGWERAIEAALRRARAPEPAGERLDLARGHAGVRRVHGSPPLFEVDGFLCRAECEAMMGYAASRLTCFRWYHTMYCLLFRLYHTMYCLLALRCFLPPRALIPSASSVPHAFVMRHSFHSLHAARSNTGGKISDIRTSCTCYVDRHHQLSQTIFHRVAQLTGCAADRQEDVQVARYEAGQYYRGHFDGADPHDHDAEAFFLSGGQRICTVLIYLNDVAEGGATRFPLIGVDVRPRQGRALVFFPGFLDGKLDKQVYHEALAAVSEKWVSQIWIRQVADPCRNVPKAWVDALAPAEHRAHAGGAS
ncbi:hypothetical protein AB1Y20_007446 [Prymnesium parvum]|uniref:Fe2OG dioxygenase domain-containing protein n=1 Tax=Prymnesium parvum TaxID=97485 RepID=A0AB34IX35_PRYPA